MEYKFPRIEENEVIWSCACCDEEISVPRHQYIDVSVFMETKGWQLVCQREYDTEKKSYTSKYRTIILCPEHRQDNPENMYYV